MEDNVVKKLKIKEFIDKELNIIGYNDEPTSGPDMETKAGKNTTDQNVRIGHQNFDYDFLGRFGFTMWEGKETNPLVRDLAEFLYEKSDSNKEKYSQLTKDHPLRKKCEAMANESMEIIRKHIKEVAPQIDSKDDSTITESELKKMIEDIVIKKKKDKMPVKTDNDVLPKNLKDKISKLSKTDRELVVKYIKEME